MLSLFLFVLGFIILIKGADLLVDGASAIARKFNVSELAIGLTVVAFGTSMPELSVNLVASFEGKNEIAIGNILGSNIANILLILGISSVISPIRVTRGTAWKEIPFSLFAALLLGVLANDKLIDNLYFSALTRIDGIVLFTFFIIFMLYSISIAHDENGINECPPAHEIKAWKGVGMIILGLIGLIVGGEWIVNGAVKLAKMIGMSEAFIGLTLVAVGTSLPELATSAVAVHKKNYEIAVGNVVGSNIFNIFFILGISSMINPLEFNIKSNFDIGMVILASLFLFCCLFVGKKLVLTCWNGILFIILYVIYITFLVFID